MIARIFIPLLLLIVLSDLYIDRRLLRRKTRYLWWQRVLWWLPGLLMCAYTIFLATEKNFAPDSMAVLNVYLFLLGVFIVPKALFALCSLMGWGHCRFHHTKNNWGNLVGLILAIVAIVIVVYGSAFGFSKVVVRHEDYYSADLPTSFDGLRIVHFSDAHVGTYEGGKAKILDEIVDSINAQKADIVCFTGDIQNMTPKELYPVMQTLGRIKAKSNAANIGKTHDEEQSMVFSVLGNHDYSEYIKASDAIKVANERELVSLERQLGWHLLLNENSVIRRNNDSIVVAGMENDGRKPFPAKGDISKAMSGVKPSAFTIMLEHDPTSWRRTILPKSHAQLTLSGHTHAMQFSVFGFSPAALVYKEWGGMYNEGTRAINVSTGMGGFIPFRFGASNEIVVITLHKKQQ